MIRFSDFIILGFSHFFVFFWARKEINDVLKGLICLKDDCGGSPRFHENINRKQRGSE
jgi:hypothetical protein